MSGKATSKKLDGAARVRAAQQLDRVQRAQPREIAEGWKRVARTFARDHGLDLGRVLDTFEEQASLALYDGAAWEDAQAYAWAAVNQLLASRTNAAA